MTVAKGGPGCWPPLDGSDGEQALIHDPTQGNCLHLNLVLVSNLLEAAQQHLEALPPTIPEGTQRQLTPIETFLANTGRGLVAAASLT